MTQPVAPLVGKTLSPIRRRRLLLGLSQDEVAKAVGCAPSHLSRAENGFTRLSPDVEARLLKVLGMERRSGR